MQVATFIISVYIMGLGECRMVPYVVDGGDADIDDFPYVAHLGIHCMEFDKRIEIFICGSSIINQHLTLTAAHCLFYCLEDTNISVSVGHVDTHRAVISSALSFDIHEDYCQKTADNDIALVRVTTPIKFNARVSRVALMPDPPYDQEARLAGWGLIDEQAQKKPMTLKFTEQLVWDRKKCLKKIKLMPKGTFCAGSKTLRGYASVGDSGSPLVVRNYIQIGIVSYKYPDVSRSMTIYTDTGHFYKWIQENAIKIFCHQ